MLSGYLIKRLYGAFLIVLVTLSLVFVCADLLIRLSALPSFFSLPKILGLMMPVMILFCFPLASSLAVQRVVGNLYLQDEVLFFQFFAGARRTLHLIVLFFSISLLALYIPLVATWAPTSYWKAKNYIISSIKEQFEHLAPQTFHPIAPHVTFSFRKRDRDQAGATRFVSVILSVREKGTRHYFITAESCSLVDSALYISNGTIHTRSGATWYSGTFEQTEVSLHALLQSEKEEGRQPKFCTLSELSAGGASNALYRFEMHKRMAQIFWQLLFPLIALWGMLIIGQRKSNLLGSILLSGGLFVYSYIGLNLAQSFARTASLALLFLYGCSSLAFVLFYALYKRKW